MNSKNGVSEDASSLLYQTTGNWSFEDLEKHLDECFGVTGYLDCYPCLRCKDYWQVVMLDGRVVGCCSTIPFHWYRNDFMKIGFCLGSVAVSASLRHQGIARYLIEKSLKKSEESLADFVLLFSSNQSFYSKFGFIPSEGDQLVHLENKKLQEHVLKKMLQLKKVHYLNHTSVTHTKSKDLDSISLSKIWVFLSKYSSKYESNLSYLDFCLLCRIPDLMIVEMNKNGVLQGICFWGKGIDFTNVAHGCVSSKPEAGWVILNHILNSFKDNSPRFWLNSPSQKCDLSSFSQKKESNIMIKYFDSNNSFISKSSDQKSSGKFFLKTIQSC